MFSKAEQATQEVDSLIRCKIVLTGNRCEDYQKDDLILVRADLLRKPKYGKLDGYLTINNENLIYCKLNEYTTH